MNTGQKILTALAASVLLFLLFLGKPSAAPSTPVMVTQVDVDCRAEDFGFARQYTQPENISAILNYLRLLDYKGSSDTDPETLGGISYRITLTYSDGHQQIYRQQEDTYISKDFRAWEKLNPEQGALLLLLLKQMPGD